MKSFYRLGLVSVLIAVTFFLSIQAAGTYVLPAADENEEFEFCAFMGFEQADWNR